MKRLLIVLRKGRHKMKDKYLYWLDRIEGLGSMAKKNLLEAFGTAEEIYRGQKKYFKLILDEKKLALILKAQEQLEIEQPFESARREGIQLICYKEQGFPEKLRNIPDAPFAIYYKGRLPDEALPSVAVIGARECSGYGEYVACELGKLLGEQGIQVISGMAKGIDGLCQSVALEAGGISFGVLGCGVDICYPKSNYKLYEKLIQTGGVISTYAPGTQPQAKLFPPRNRIVSGLADVLVVIEARQKSGTYITVEMALEQGREIYAVPGRVTDRLSDGCNKMLKDGAHVFLSPQDFLMDMYQLLPLQMKVLKQRERSNVLRVVKPQIGEELSGDWIQQTLDFMEGEEQESQLGKAILEVLDFYPQPIEKIAVQLQERYQILQKPEDLTTRLMYMCLYGQVKQDSAGWFSKK